MEESLILAVSHHPTLYNMSIKEYKNQIKREAAWFAVSVETGSFKFQVLFVTYTTIQRLYNQQ